MADSINGSDHGILNWDTPTRVPPNAEPSSPGVSLASSSLITSCSWQTLSMLSSDHLPILIRLQMKTTPKPGLCQTYANLNKANWDRYRLEVEAALSKRSLPTDCQRDEKILRTILLKAASHHIPIGRHRLHEELVPAEILEVMTRRDDIRKRDRTSPELPRLNKDIQKHICEHKRQKWRDFVDNMDHKTDITKLWRTIQGIDGRAKRTAENEASCQVQQTVQHFKAGQTFFFKRNPIGNEGHQEETNGYGGDFHRRHSYRHSYQTVLPLLANNRKDTLQALHTSFVNTAIGNMKDNIVLNSRPPSINDEETLLQRRQRTTLSQLRSGHCKLLNSYKKRLKRSDSSRCPDCGMDPQDVPHLFDCVAHPNVI